MLILQSSILSSPSMKDLHPKKFMSSKDLYFLPLIKEVKLKSKQASSAQKLPPFKHKSIEDILNTKQGTFRKNDNCNSFTLCNKDVQNTIDLYDKYESLPKIYMQRNRKQEDFGPYRESRPEGKRGLKCQDNEETKIEDQSSYLKNKENSFNFNEMYYKEHFNRRLLEQTQKINFKLSYNYSQKGLLLANPNQEAQLSQRHLPPVKYIRLDTAQQQTTSLQKIPDFLMKLIEPQKHLQQ